MIYSDEQVARAQVAWVVGQDYNEGGIGLDYGEIIERCKELTTMETVIAIETARNIGVIEKR